MSSLLFFFFLEHFGSVMRLIRTTIAELTAKLASRCDKSPPRLRSATIVNNRLVSSISPSEGVSHHFPTA